MIRAWIAIALLSVFWLLGFNYYVPAAPLAAFSVVVSAVLLLWGVVDRLPKQRELLIAGLLMIPAVWFAGWPSVLAPLLVVLGVGLQLAPIPREWTKKLAAACVATGVVLLVQWLTMAVYSSQMAASHELPWPLAEMLAGMANLVGIDATYDGTDIVMHSMRQVHRLAATWELLLDPATLCFLTGSAAMLAMVAWSRLKGDRRWTAWTRGIRLLALLAVLWIPLCALLIIAIYAHRVLRAAPEQPLYVMNHLFSPWVHLAMLAALVLLAWRFAPIANVTCREGKPQPMRWTFAVGVVCMLLAAMLITFAVDWDPIGTRKQGRVQFVERHSTWEPTTTPYDTEFFGHDSGYNYAAIYDYLTQYYEMSRLLETDKIDDDSLADCDVLVIKTPTARYSEDEVDAVVRFVERGGGLLFIGDHTNYEKGSTYMNDISRQMGFAFRPDLLFGAGDWPYDQRYEKPRVAHPAVQHLPPLDMAVSCSIDPGTSYGRAAMVGTGLWSLPPEYHIENYHPYPEHRPEMRYGPFIQLWSTRHGDGRVLAFTDSTIFSNFCVYQPGKAELMLGMVEWLNHGGGLPYPRLWLSLPAGLLLLIGFWLVWGHEGGWLVVFAAAACGWATASMTLAIVQPLAMPAPKVERPLKRVMIDRTVSDDTLAPLSAGAYIQGNGQGFGLFEQWISRVGCYTARRIGSEAFDGDALVVICPTRSVSEEYRQGLIDYVKGGGRVLVIDTPRNNGSTANSLLRPFGMSFDHSQPWKGILTLDGDWPGVTVDLANSVTGGTPIARLGERPIGAVAKLGEGKVMALGFGPLFDDTHFGGSWTQDPTDEQKARYEVLFTLLRSLLNDEPIVTPAEKSEVPPEAKKGG